MYPLILSFRYPICENELTAFIDDPSFFTHFTASTQSVCVPRSCITLRRDASLNTKLVDEHRKIIKLEKGEEGSFLPRDLLKVGCPQFQKLSNLTYIFYTFNSFCGLSRNVSNLEKLSHSIYYFLKLKGCIKPIN